MPATRWHKTCAAQVLVKDIITNILSENLNDKSPELLTQGLFVLGDG